MPGSKNFRNGDRVSDVGSSGISKLTEVRLVSVAESFTDFVDVGTRQIKSATLGQCISRGYRINFFTRDGFRGGSRLRLRFLRRIQTNGSFYCVIRLFCETKGVVLNRRSRDAHE